MIRPYNCRSDGRLLGDSRFRQGVNGFGSRDVTFLGRIHPGRLRDSRNCVGHETRLTHSNPVICEIQTILHLLRHHVTTDAFVCRRRGFTLSIGHSGMT